MPRSQTSSGLLFVSEYCEHSTDLLDSYESFRPDLSLTVIKVDDGSKKTKALIDAYDIRGVPTLVINNEKHVEGDDVFLTLLPTEDDGDIRLLSRAPRDTVAAADDAPEACGIESFAEEEPFDFDNPPVSARELNNDQGGGLEARLQQLEAMRKQADKYTQKRNESVTNQQMMSSRQCDPCDIGDEDIFK